MQDLSSLIRKYRKEIKLTQKQLAEKIGVSASAITQYETMGSKVKPTIENLNAIAVATNKSIIDFFPNADANRKKLVKYELKKNALDYVEFLDGGNSKEIVFIDNPELKLGAGAEGVFDLELFRTDRKIGIDRRFIAGLNPVNLKVFSVVGDSMEPEYEENDLAIVDMVNHRYDFVKIPGIYMVRVGDVVYIKRVEFLPNGGLKLISLNPNYGELLPHKDGYEYEILGKVCGKIHYRIAKGLTFDDNGIR